MEKTVSAELSLLFPPFRLELDNERLWRGAQVTVLRPKTFAVLRYLAEHADQLVTTGAVLDAVWPGTYVSRTLVKDSIHELRQALGDDPKRPQFIETVHRRGYRFIAPLTTSSPVQGSRFKVHSYQPSAPSTQPPAPTLVGREAELGQLRGWLEKALAGERQVVFVTGEPGIGKTTMVDAFLQSLEARGQPESGVWSPESGVGAGDSALRDSGLSDSLRDADPRRQTLDTRLWIGRGQCMEHHGASEAYLPILEALGRMCREPDGERLIELLAHHAPSWLVQMPALLSPAELETLQRKVAGATRERMLRKMAEALEVVTRERPLVLWLGNLHWSDYSTLDLLAYLARRREVARLLVLGTYRPVEMLGKEHPLRAVKQELQLHGHCEEMRLGCLTEKEVGEYLAGRFPGSPPPAGLARVIHRRTEGNPLFMVTMADYLIARGALVESGGRWKLNGQLEAVKAEVPENLQRMIERQLERLSPKDQEMLEIASVVGAEFSAAAVAAGVEAAVKEVEARCAGLVRREHFLRVRGTSEWPDGTVAARYEFLHTLYQYVVYERVPAGQRMGLHQRIGEREEAAYGDRAGEIAAELAVHFERGRDYRRAIQYLQQAGENALRRSAHIEAIHLLTKGLEVLKSLPDTSERTQHELRLQIALGPSLQATQGYAAPEVEQAFTRARELCRQVGETPELFPVLMGLCAFYIVRGELQTARELGEQLLRLAQSVQDPARLLEAHLAFVAPLFYLGEFAPARAHLEQSLALYDPQQPRSHVFLSGQDPVVACLSYAAYTLWHLGYPDQALKRSHEALTLAQELAHPYSLAFALSFAIAVHRVRREGQATQERAEAVLTLCTEQGFPYWWAMGTMFRGWTLAQQGQGEEGIAQIRHGLATLQATGAELLRPYFLALLAEACGQVGQTQEGLRLLAEALALVGKNGVRYSEAELYRLKGELTLQQSKVQSLKSKVSNTQHPTPSTHAEAEECFWRAIEIARRQEAKSWELRAVMSLSRLWQSQGKKKQARRMLAEIYGWFTEGFDTADLQEARVLLEELSGHPEARRRKQG